MSLWAKSLLISLSQNKTGSVPLGSRNSSSRSINLEGDGAIVVGGYDLAISGLPRERS